MAANDTQMSENHVLTEAATIPSDGLEDMLYGLPSSHEDAGPDFFDEDLLDEDLLDDSDGDDLILWDVQDDASTLPSSVDEQLFGDLDNDGSRPAHLEAELPNNNSCRQLHRDRHWIIERIEKMLERIIDDLAEECEALTITLRSRAGLTRRQMKPTSSGQTPVVRERNISFPGANAQEAWNFTVLLRILELVHGALVDNTIMTKRDIYYRHPELFVKQSVVDRYVDDLACTFGVSRVQLNVTAAAKGLVAGSFSITRDDGHQVDGNRDADGLLVPRIGQGDTLSLTSVQWILIIEKEATFRSVLTSPHWKELGACGVVLTAKGYPDLTSRIFLSHIVGQVPHIPVYALVDLDPDGIAIMSTYKYGSCRLAHEENARDTPSLSLPNIHWLGVRGHQLSPAQDFASGSDNCVMSELQGLMKLTARDRTKATRMLEWDLCAEDGPEPEWRQELQRMLMLNVKAEIQILEELTDGLSSWLITELDTAEQIFSSY